jgi:hypothetical protein
MPWVLDSAMSDDTSIGVFTTEIVLFYTHPSMHHVVVVVVVVVHVLLFANPITSCNSN